MDNFETIAKQTKERIMCIYENDTIIARGILINNAVFYFHDNNQSNISYPDTGVFVLFAGSRSSSVNNEKYKKHIDSDGATTREIIFQSANAAAQFVKGTSGNTNCWKYCN